MALQIKGADLNNIKDVKISIVERCSYLLIRLPDEAIGMQTKDIINKYVEEVKENG